jgi:hypothetical protein
MRLSKVAPCVWSEEDSGVDPEKGRRGERNFQIFLPESVEGVIN